MSGKLKNMNTSSNLEEYLKLVKTPNAVQRLKVSDHRHPCHEDKNHRLMQARVRAAKADLGK